MVETKYNRVDEVIKERALVLRKTRTASGYKGVIFRKTTGRYESTFQITDGITKQIRINLGTYSTPEEAYIARCKFIDSLK